MRTYSLSCADTGQLLRLGVLTVMVGACFFAFHGAAFAQWSGLPYAPGETLNPECAPEDIECYVVHTDGFSVAAANIWLATKSTDNLPEGTSNLYFTNTRADARADARIGAATSTIRSMFSAGPGLSFTDGAFSVASGYSIPLTASTTEWHNLAQTIASSSSNWNTAFSWGNHATAGYLSTTTAAATYYPLSNPAGYTSNTGTVTSVAASVPTGLTVTGSPITTNGTLAFGWQAGYTPVLTASTTQWDNVANLIAASSPAWNNTTALVSASSSQWSTAFNWGNHATAGYLTTVATSTIHSMFSAGTGLAYANGIFSLSTSTPAATDALTLEGYDGAYYLNRANHTGTQLASTISDFASSTRGLFSADAPLVYNSATGAFSVASGYDIPLSASTSEWNNTANLIASSSTNWNTAFSWGNHATAGYLTSIPGTYLQTGDNVSELINDVGYLTAIATSTVRGMLAAGTGLTYVDGVFTVATSSLAGLDATTLNGQDASYYLNRANHTGTQLASTISDFATTARGLFSGTGPITYNSSTGEIGFTNPGYTSNTGTVTSVGLSAPTGFTTSGSPITTNGTLGLAWAAGYSPVLTASTTEWHNMSNLIAASSSIWNNTSNIVSASSSNWNTAFSWGNHATAGYLSTTTAAATYYPLSNPAGYTTNTGTVTSIATGNGITGGTITTTGTLGLTGQALALHNLGTNGLIARTAAGTVAARTLTTSATGLTITNGDGVSGNPAITLTAGYAIPLTASTTAWNNTTNLVTASSANWNLAYSWGDHSLAGYLDRENHTGTQLASTISDFAVTTRGLFSENIPGITYTDALGMFSLDVGYEIPLTASTTNWQSFFTTPSTRITAGTNMAWAGNTLNGLSNATIRGLFSGTSPINYNSGTGAFSLGTVGVANGGTGTTTFSAGLVYSPGGTSPLMSTSSPVVTNLYAQNVYASNGMYLPQTSCGGILLALGTNSSGLVQCLSISLSDERLKDHIAPLAESDGLALIRRLSPVSYVWKDPSVYGGTENVQYGFIAQQVEQINGNLIEEGQETALTPGGSRAVNYFSIIAPLVRAVQELAERMDTFAESVTTKRLCLDDVCITSTELRALLQRTHTTSTSAPSAAPITQPAPDATPESEVVSQEDESVELSEDTDDSVDYPHDTNTN